MPKTIELGGKTWTVRPLNIKALKVLGDRVFRIGEMTVEGYDAIVDVLFYGIKREHPEIDRDLIEEWVDFPRLAAVAKLLMEVNGFVSKDAVPGEQRPVH